MGLINEYLKKIKEAVYGEEVRDSIHDAIEQCYKDATGHPDSVAATVGEINKISSNLDGEIAALILKAHGCLLLLFRHLPFAVDVYLSQGVADDRHLV